MALPIGMLCHEDHNTYSDGIVCLFTPFVVIVVQIFACNLKSDNTVTMMRSGMKLLGNQINQRSKVYPRNGGGVGSGGGGKNYQFDNIETTTPDVNEEYSDANDKVMKIKMTRRLFCPFLRSILSFPVQVLLVPFLLPLVFFSVFNQYGFCLISLLKRQYVMD